ncbi:hypothetical protein EHEL_111200 [Encephalitozoon hellem ATCC 50504]|uniref:NADPH adrenodoxin oxidoreductase-like protein n=1 Tax=Encephalitozoon hellem TaxID=27973 RepID=A0A9Q9C591_ENCHE|nr:uncharacterized protein EHEL_111200 [Encephalitozoon hellem ATCC 50504]AFM99393.1 hypothetical protein EHEL_111200 [Encephalitozoon hellem ATCC 50504]UTX44401.1 NADPH adrenodoxin oxidoreductase-like protein [Encephalitozoon hellem]|eukprot:XP_003888374.1 hypothetical protein EHEL_111200 [Encephalitozoon hellem ATCC 50504]
MKVCIIGGGPAGLYTAASLVSRNIDVTLHEKEPEVGGLYRYSLLPPSRMSPFSKLLECKNFSLKLNSEVDLQKLKTMEKDFDAFVIATGSPGPRRLSIPGREHCINGLDIAKSWAGEEPRYNVGSRVLIVGMGDVSMDITRFLFGWSGAQFKFPENALKRVRRVKDVTITSRRSAHNSAFTNSGLRKVLEIPGLGFWWSEGKEVTEENRSKLEKLRETRGHNEEDGEKGKCKGWWDRRQRLLNSVREGARRLKLMFNTDVKSIERVGSQYKVRMVQNGVPVEECFDSVISSIGFDEAEAKGLGLTKPMYRIGWAKYPRGNAERAKEDAQNTVNKIIEMKKMWMPCKSI